MNGHTASHMIHERGDGGHVFTDLSIETSGRETNKPRLPPPSHPPLNTHSPLTTHGFLPGERESIILNTIPPQQN